MTWQLNTQALSYVLSSHTNQQFEYKANTRQCKTIDPGVLLFPPKLIPGNLLNSLNLFFS